jgi:SET domain-containing protein 6
MADAEFDQRTGAFLGWFKSLPGATFHKDIQIADLRPRHAGRGISKSYHRCNPARKLC